MDCHHPQWLKDLSQRFAGGSCDIEYGPATDAEIKETEDALGTNFGTSFRDFLRAYAGGIMFELEIFGIETARSMAEWGDSRILSIVHQNELWREAGGPCELTVFSGEDGYSFCLDSRPPAETDNPIVIQGPNAPEGDRRLAPDFAGFMRRLAIHGEHFLVAAKAEVYVDPE